MIGAKRFLFVIVSVFACTAAVQAFPSEEQVKSKLRQGMTADEVVALFGEPNNGRPVPCVDCTINYLAPFGSRTVEKEGYTGVQIRFAEGKVRDWRLFISNPSYAEPKMPPEVRRFVSFFPIMFGIGLGLKWLIRWTPVASVVANEVAQAFENREIQTEQLPTDFRFITSETTLAEVVKKLGKPSRVVKVPISAERGLGYALASSNPSAATIVTFEYDLPYHAAVIVMPEFPFEQQSRIRAAFYRPIQPELAETTE